MTNYYQLTQPQRRIWVSQKANHGSPMFNIGGSVTIYGDIDIGKLKTAISDMIAGHDAFRLRFCISNGYPVQYISDEPPLNVGFISFEDCDDPLGSFLFWEQQQAKIPMTLDDAPLYEFIICHIEKDIIGYFMKMHHIIMDGWSIQIITEEVKERYECLIEGRDFEGKPPSSYLSFIESEQEYINSFRYEKDRQYWNNRFHGLLGKKKTLESLKGRREIFPLSTRRMEIIRTLCKQHKISMNALFVSLYMLFMYKQTGEEEIVIGNPVLGRTKGAERRIIGMFVSSMPFYYKIKDSIGIIDFIKDVDINLKQSFKHQRYPYNHLITDLGVGDVLYDHCVNYYNTSICNTISGYKVNNREFYNGEQGYSLQLIIREWSEQQIQVEVDYITDKYEAWQITDMVSRIGILADKIYTEPDCAINAINILTSDEIKLLTVDFNQSYFHIPKHESIISLFVDVVKQFRNNTAVRDGDRAISYGELARKSFALAEKLKRNGARGGKIIGMYTTHSVETFIGIWGVILSGNAYMPIEQTYPSERINYMLTNASISILLTNSKLPDNVNFNGAVMDIAKHCEPSNGQTDSSPDVKGEDLVYVIYTSGSTGFPKGVMVQHSALLNYLSWAISQYEIGHEDVMPLYSSFGFDLSVTTLFAPLLAGGTVVIYRDDGEHYVLYRIFDDNNCTLIKMTPAHMELIKGLNNSRRSIKRMIIGGESLSASLASSVAESFCGDIIIYNEYGPTEATVGCMVHRYHPEEKGDTVPIGIPAANTRLYVLDKNKNPLPIRYEGELYVAGDGLSKGYLQLEELTAERFVAGENLSEKRMYKTGDIVKFIDLNCLEYLGRVDNQIKINGFRVELAEIERCIANYRGVGSAVALDIQCGDTLVIRGFYTFDSKYCDKGLWDYISDRLPKYMIPSDLIRLEMMPLTGNGKVDIVKLRGIIIEETKDVVEGGEFGDKEKTLIDVLEDILKVRVRLSDNFYSIGGDSIKAIQLSSKMREHRYILSFNDVMTNPNIRDMVQHITIEEPKDIYENLQGDFLPLPIAMNFFLQKRVSPHTYAQSMVLKMGIRHDRIEYEMILSKLIAYHDALRISVGKGNRLYYSDNIKGNGNVDIIEILDSDEGDRLKIFEAQFKVLSESIDLDTGRVLRSVVCRFPDTDYWLIVIHHLAVDGMSWRIIFDDIQRMINQIEMGQDLLLSPKTDSYKAWSEYINGLADELSDERSFWEEISYHVPLKIDITHVMWPTKSRNINFRLSIDPKALLKANDAFGTTTEELLLAALSFSGIHYVGDPLTILLERHGRDAADSEFDISRTVGWFTSVFPIILSTHADDIGQHVINVKEKVRNVPNKGIGFGLCIEPERLHDIGITWICFNFLGEIQNKYSSFNVDINESSFYGTADIMNCLEVIGFISGNMLYINIRYPDHPLLIDRICSFSDSFKRAIDDIIRFCAEKKTKTFTPSDFSAAMLTQKDLDIIFGDS